VVLELLLLVVVLMWFVLESGKGVERGQGGCAAMRVRRSWQRTCATLQSDRRVFGTCGRARRRLPTWS
jgi:hypothetical protein